ncbi:hypothetical protein KT99_11188 [Shewanella benthica KT99]|uniref:Uncharacterized protein n=1 Tax=Shewanella benthica KT99 TaxID=314608 RepID=A9DC94_9GAMM|nr:hypothetical protein KT99_11188 [Shewanella benthica KT99]
MSSMMDLMNCSLLVLAFDTDSACLSAF